MKVIFKNLLKAIGIMCYFIILNFAYTRMNTDRLINDIEVFSGIFLVIGLVMLEIAYKKDSGKSAISGIELLVLSMHSLSINHIITFYKYDFRFYLLVSSYVFAIYYVLKSVIIYTKEKREYLKSLSDISEIVKEEPIKKEAKKRSQEEAIDDKEDKSKKTNKEKSVKKEQTKESKAPKSKEVKNRTKKETKKEEREPKEVKSKEKRQTKPKTKNEVKKEEINKTKRTKKAKKEVKEND